MTLKILILSFCYIVESESESSQDERAGDSPKKNPEKAVDSPKKNPASPIKKADPPPVVEKSTTEPEVCT